MERVSVTCRLNADDVAFLDQLAQSLERDRTYLIKTAVSDFVDARRRELAAIEQALAEADAGEFATGEEVQAALDRRRP